MSCMYSGVEGCGSLWNLFSFRSKSSWLQNIPDNHVINVAVPLSGMSPTQILMVSPPRPCCLHNAQGHISFCHATHTNSHGLTSSSLSPSQCTRTHFLLSCHPHKFSWSHLLQLAVCPVQIHTLPYIMPLTQILMVTPPPGGHLHNTCGHTSSNHARCIRTLFLLACHPCYFCIISVKNSCFLLFSFNQNLTSAAALTDVKEVFK